jgi:hypothetical protein
MPELKISIQSFPKSNVAGLEIACCIFRNGYRMLRNQISYAVASGMHFSENSAFFIIMRAGCDTTIVVRDVADSESTSKFFVSCKF